MIELDQIEHFEQLRKQLESELFKCREVYLDQDNTVRDFAAYSWAQWDIKNRAYAVFCDCPKSVDTVLRVVSVPCNLCDSCRYRIKNSNENFVF